MPDTIRSIRARARTILAAAGVQYATSSPSRIRGMKNWSSGVTIDELWRGGALAYITPRYDIREVRKRDLDRAVTALRAAGWTVEDDGKIVAVPPKA